MKGNELKNTRDLHIIGRTCYAHTHETSNLQPQLCWKWLMGQKLTFTGLSRCIHLAKVHLPFPTQCRQPATASLQWLHILKRSVGRGGNTNISVIFWSIQLWTTRTHTHYKSLPFITDLKQLAFLVCRLQHLT